MGHDIIREQRFFRKELEERVHWFIRLRWAAVAAGLAGIALGWTVLPVVVRLPLLAVVLLGGMANIAFLRASHRLETARPEDTSRLEIFAHVQISFDLLALFIIVYLTGGASSPFLVFSLFHVVLAGILLSPPSCYAYAGLISLGCAAILGLHHVGRVPDWPQGLSLPFTSLPTFPLSNLTAWLAVFAAGLLITAYLVTSLKITLRSKGRELMKVSLELEISNSRLTSLYEMMKEVASNRTRQGLMDAAVRNAARIMGVKACSIKLLDEDRDCLRFSATHGLSGDYLSRECIRVDESPVNRRILEGSLYSIGSIGDESVFQYPENIRQEGIASMLCLPLKVENKILGVFCVYSGKEDFFQEADVSFFSLMTDLTALSMDNIFREALKTWFLNKAAHQLRSPLGTVNSMLKTLEGGYQGRLSDDQRVTVERCLARVDGLRAVIDDLLTLAAGRRESRGRAGAGIDPAAVLQDIRPAYLAQASGKGVEMTFSINSGPALVEAPGSMVEDVFSNLISNALKYTPRGGRAWVRLFTDERGDFVFEVEDTGIGIPEADMPRLFTEFFRAENAKATVGEGSGLGLAIVKEAINAMDGRIDVQSKPGAGTRIRCILPVSASGAAVA